MGQLYAMRALLDNLIGQLEDAQPKPAPKVICLHPEEQRTYRGSMGNVTGFHCKRCDQEVDSAE